MTTCPHPQPCADVGRCRFDGDCGAPAKRARAEVFRCAECGAAWRIERQRDLCCTAEPEQTPPPLGWATLENVR